MTPHDFHGEECVDLGAEGLRRGAELREGSHQLWSWVSLSMATAASVSVVGRKNDHTSTFIASIHHSVG